MMVTMVTDQLLQQTIDNTNDNSQVHIIVTLRFIAAALPCGVVQVLRGWVGTIGWHAFHVCILSHLIQAVTCDSTCCTTQHYTAHFLACFSCRCKIMVKLLWLSRQVSAI